MLLYDENGELLDIPDEMQIEICVEYSSVSRGQAQFMLAIAKGEIEGDKAVFPYLVVCEECAHL